MAITGRTSILRAIAYGVAVGVGFLGSPVVQSLGVGLFGRDFGWHFAATVLLAHVAFGATLGVLLERFESVGEVSGGPSFQVKTCGVCRYSH